jgi:hypothetical protein
MVRTGLNPTLATAVARGQYVVNERAVAEAILRRSETRPRSGVLVSSQALDHLPARSEEDGAAAGGDFA